MIETAMVGRDGVVNATSALDGKMALHKGLVQAAGTASVITGINRVAKAVGLSNGTVARVKAEMAA